ncbi:uncharacterized protein LOC107417630 [Ziziphus jujuba]|uniref:Uncharacterized protein LOC107417630 n=2 Tax=Ziziphus jujuba TaxID=326968 RepID=A0A6P3ZMP4_ZIZJJ|nr:uncharacterized protein LOC107417630 [Ziziphus jujuba]KAH7516768.1 hypothetical protein FEM48_Zijuj10G0169800 [Ziziphus jujuba var. spinosa]
MFPPMDPIVFLFLLLLTSFFTFPVATSARSAKGNAKITVVGAVYCDTCSANAFSRHSYFLPGADVQIQCKFKANTPETTEQMNFAVNRTTDKHGVYKLDIPSVDGVNCIKGLALVSMCHATLIRSSSSACNFPALRTASDEISVKSEQDNLCIYSLNAMSFRPTKKNTTLCGNQKEELAKTFDSSKCFFPFFPPYKFPWPPLSSFPFPPLPPLSSLPFPLPPFTPIPSQSPPSLPFPFPPLPPLPPTPSLFAPPPPPAFSLTDPRTWFPPLLSPPPPPPPAFSLRDPKTWIPHLPPSPPKGIQNKNSP